jgi:hypothetical protein
MTSSWLIQERKKMSDVWNIDRFGNPKDPLGGMEDHYITPGHTHECHPNYEAIPIGNPYGFLMCKKRTYPNGRPLDVPPVHEDLSKYNGYHKFQADLYAPPDSLPRQISNPDYYYNRVIPNEESFHRDDYIAREMGFNGTGIKMAHTPGPRVYNEYCFDFTPLPPYKYDIQRLHQPYTVWRNEQAYKGVSEQALQKLDQEYFNSSTMGVW